MGIINTKFQIVLPVVESEWGRDTRSFNYIYNSCFLKLGGRYMAICCIILYAFSHS